MRTCCRCGEAKPHEAFARDASKASGAKSLCKACDNLKSKAYYERNRERKLAKYHAKPKRIHYCECGRRREPRHKRCPACEAAPLIVGCGHCGAGVVLRTKASKKNWHRYGQAHCSIACRLAYARKSRWATAALARIDRALAVVTSQPITPLLHSGRRCQTCGTHLPHNAHASRRYCDSCHWVAPRKTYHRDCERCGKPFTTHRASRRYCTAECAKRAARRRGKDLRRARRQSNGKTERVTRRKVYERDGWRCQLCRKKVKRDAEVPDPRAPTLDHIVPLSLGGEHTYANTQCACFICNTRKRTHAEGEQLRLIGHV